MAMTLSLASAWHWICARKQLFIILPSCKIDLVEEVYYSEQVFHLLHDKIITPAEALLCFSLLS